MLLFALLIAIRFVLVFSLYPITSRIGIGTNIKESVFMSYGGFRGSVGIALSLSLEARLYNNTDEGSEQRDNVDKVFCFVGGISVLTLLINGMTSAPLLSKVSAYAVFFCIKGPSPNSVLYFFSLVLPQERTRGG